MLKKFKKLFSKRKFDTMVLLVVVVVAIITFIISDTITKNKSQVLMDAKINIYSKKLQDEIQALIKNKREATLTIALSLAEDKSLKEAIYTKDTKYLDLKTFSLKLREQTRFKNVWFQVIDKKGIALYRSWIPKKGDAIINSRLDVAKMIKKPEVMCTISTGKFDMTIKSMVPIYDNGSFIGMFEVITHFNSIVKQLGFNDIGAIVLVNKKYKNQLTKAMTKTFLDDYYIANLNPDENLLEYLQSHGVDKFFNNRDNYILDANFGKLITFYNIPDIYGKPMGTIVAFKDLDSINTYDVEYVKSNIIFYTVLFVLLLALIGYYIVVSKHAKELTNKVKERTEELNREKTYIQTILDTNPSIIAVTKDNSLITGNKSLLEFFGFTELSEFKKKHNCICEFFISLDDKEFPADCMIEGKLWTQYLAFHEKKDFLIKLKFNNQFYFFTISVLKLTDENEMLITMQNITELKSKDKLLYEQSKMASLGEMIGNIAHQWRQPLSVISTGVTGMQLQKEYGLLEDEQFNKTCIMINNNTQYLSKTIDDFKNFIKGDSKPIQFDLKNDINDFVNIVDSSIKNYQIDVILNLLEDTAILGYPNELMQCFINIFNNSKDALITNNAEDDRLIFISQKIENDNILIEFKDNANGIDESIIDKIFDPYFTTKHKSQGTGLGLNMTYNLIVNAMKGDIKASNVEYRFNGKDYKGACFKITIPIT